jgi:DNA polymerase III delta prime subunit
MTTLIDKSNITFEEILQLFTSIDTPEKGIVMREKMALFLKGKSIEERKFYGSILLSITQDNAMSLLRMIRESKDLSIFNNLENALTELKKAA